MLWISVAIGVIVSSALMYLMIRQAKFNKISLESQNLAMFAIPAMIYVVFNIASDIDLSISWQHLLILLVTAICFSWLGNLASLRALAVAPNPGYSLIISKSYVVLSTILAVPLFGSELTPKSCFAILIVIASSSIIMVGKNDRKKSNKTWILYTLGAFCAWAFLALVLTYLGQQGLQPTQITFYLMLFVTILIGTEMIVRKSSLPRKRNDILLFIGIGIASAVFNLCLVWGYQVAPNPGYINAANTASIALLSILSWLVFKDSLSKTKVAGIIGIVAGLLLLFI